MGEITDLAWNVLLVALLVIIVYLSSPEVFAQGMAMVAQSPTQVMGDTMFYAALQGLGHGIGLLPAALLLAWLARKIWK
jgi:hypothetical protein